MTPASSSSDACGNNICHLRHSASVEIGSSSASVALEGIDCATGEPLSMNDVDGDQQSSQSLIFRMKSSSDAPNEASDGIWHALEMEMEDCVLRPGDLQSDISEGCQADIREPEAYLHVANKTLPHCSC